MSRADLAVAPNVWQDYQINPKCHAPVEWDSSGNDVSVADLEAFESAMTFDGCASWVIDRVTMPVSTLRAVNLPHLLAR